MKKAYNVYSILGKTVSKAAMLTSVFALCFLFSGQVFSQSTYAHTNQALQTDYEQHIGVTVPYSTLHDNQERLDATLVKPENALPIVMDLSASHSASYNAAANASQEMEFELRRVFLVNLASQFKQGALFNTAFNTASLKMAEQMSSYDASLYAGPTLKAITEGYIVNFF